MRTMMTFAGSVMLTLALLMAPDMMAQTRSTGGGNSRSTGQSTRSTTSQSSGSSTRSSGSSGSSTRSSGSSSSVRSSGSSSSSRSSGSSVSSGSSSSRSSSSSVSTGSSSSRSGSSSVRSSSSSSRSNSASFSTSSGQQDNNRRTNSGSSSSSSSSNVRSSTGSSSSSGSARSVTGSVSSSSSVRSTGNAGASGTARVAGAASVQEQQKVTSTGNASASGAARSGSNVSRNGLSAFNSVESTGSQNSGAYRDAGGNYRYNDDMRVDDRHNMYRVPPRQRDFMAWDRAGYFWGDHPHYYGYRIHSLPVGWRHISHWGLDYYYYNGIYYRPFGGYYVVCRPPFGTALEHAIDRAILQAIRFSYYCDTYRTYESAFDYYNVIARQNLIIAQQNAHIIAQNAGYALNANRALTAYELANKLGLVQSYAYANSEYYYQDGVFYTISASGVYTTIVPPAGALVTSLPDDYEVIVMNGIEYYMVDNTVYRTTLFEGVPYLEVLGQMYGSLYNQYNVYR